MVPMKGNPRENLPAAWSHLSRWLERNDIFDGEEHRRLVLPAVDSRRSIISHSWKLSFPCRSDRKRLYEVLGRYQKQRDMHETVDRQMISKIYHHGGFTPEFTAALKQQIGLIQKGNHAEEWLISLFNVSLKRRV